MGLAGSVHCAAMCGPLCMALGQGRLATPSTALFHLGRLASYSAAGAVVAAGVGALATLAQWAPALRPLWTLVHAGALVLGLWLLWQGRQPAWVERLGKAPADARTPEGWQRVRAPARAGAAGLAWAAWPCGLLQSALMTAALANDALGGAAVMAAFACTSALGLLAAPTLRAVWARRGGGEAMQSLVVRAAGALLAAGSAWALGHDLIMKVVNYCLG